MIGCQRVQGLPRNSGFCCDANDGVDGGFNAFERASVAAMGNLLCVR